MEACPDPEALAELATPGTESDARASIADHAAGCESCHAALVMLIGQGDRDQVDRIDRYVIVRRIGAGGMGVVYAARDPELGRDLAIKMLRRGHSAERLRREAQALARLSHPNVVAVHDVGEHEGHVFVAMALVDGVNLREWLATPRSTEDILAALRQAARGIIAAHEAGLIHRDLKPDNIFVAADGTVLVGDFGLARDAGDLSAELGETSDVPVLDITVTGTVLGTPAYMAPEQAAGRATPASDQFSFCVTAFEALYGARPHPGRTLDELLASARSGEIVIPRGRDVPARVERALRRGLHASPDQRFASMVGLLQALEPPRRRWPLAVAGTVVLGSAIAGTIVLARGSAAPDPEVACAPTATLIDATWNATQHAAVETALRTHGNTADAVAELPRRLDAYAAHWTAVRRATCLAEAAHELAPAQAAARVACLETRRAQLSATITVVSGESADDVFSIWKRVSALPAPEGCASDEVALMSPATAEHQELVSELSLALTAGELAAVGARADKSSDLAARLEIALAIARNALDDSHVVAADAALEKARPIAEQLGAQSPRIRAFALSARSLCIQGRDTDATRFLDLAMAGAKRLSAQERDVVADEVDEARDECMYRRRQFAELVPLLQARAARIRTRYGVDGIEELEIHRRLAMVYIELGQLDDSKRESDLAARIHDRFFEGTMADVIAENDASLRAYQEGDLEGALYHSRRLVELATPFGGLGLVSALVSLGDLYDITEDAKAAIQTYSLAIERVPAETTEEELASNGALAFDGRGMMHLRQNELDAALSDFDEAIARARKVRRADIVAAAQVGLGRTWFARGEHARAVRTLREGLATYRGGRTGAAQFALAQALWETGEREAAKAMAKTAETEAAKLVAVVKANPLARKLLPRSEDLLSSVERWRDGHR